MKISALIKILQEKQRTYGDVEVEITVEGLHNDFYEDQIYFTKFGSLFISADGTYNKEEFADE
jgi:hypothetical protein